MAEDKTAFLEDEDLFGDETEEDVFDTDEDLFDDEDSDEEYDTEDEDNEDPFDEDDTDEEYEDEDEDDEDLYEEETDEDDILGTIEPTQLNLDEVIDDEEPEEDKVVAFSDTDNKDMFMFDKGSYTILPTQQIEISKLAYSTPMKEGRRETITGLNKSIRESGVLTPIDVILLPEPDPEMRQIMEEEGETIPEYLLLSGLRRVFSSIKNGYKTIPANIWDFKDKEQGQKAALELGLWLNRTQKHSWGEIWSLYTVLEEQSQIRPAMAEFLFQLEGGDAMKLKDVMLCEYPEIREELLNNTKTLEQSYKQLMKERKEEDELENSDAKGLSDTSDETSSIVDGNDNPDNVTPLDNAQVMKLMEMTEDLDTVESDDFNELNSVEETVVQDVKNRTFVDPLVKKTVLFRDNFTCTCCGTGGAAFLDVIIFHHIIPVHAGGEDSVENGTTLCDTCHLTLHVAERNLGRLPMSKEQFDEYSPEQQERIKNILRLAKIAYKADKMQGYSREEIEKLARSAASHRMPGQNIKENLSLYKEAEEKGRKVVTEVTEPEHDEDFDDDDDE